MKRSETIILSAEKRSREALQLIRCIAFGERPAEEDPLVRYADPDPPRDVRLDPVKRHNFAARRLGR